MTARGVLPQVGLWRLLVCLATKAGKFKPFWLSPVYLIDKDYMSFLVLVLCDVTLRSAFQVPDAWRREGKRTLRHTSEYMDV
jgi:hypothetical protein